MTACTDPQLADRLHDYELSLLDEDARREFELHLYECESYFEQYRQFAAETRLLRSDPDVHATVREATDDTVKVGSQRTIPAERGRAPERWWVVRSLAMAAVLIAIAIPIYFLARPTGEVEPADQIIQFLPVRDIPSHVLFVAPVGTVEFHFAMNGVAPNVAVDIAITDAMGDTIKAERRFTDFDEHGQGRLRAPLNSFVPGHYFLTIYSREAAPQIVAQYTFRAE